MNHSYYGRLDGQPKGDNLAMTLINEEFKKLIKKNESKLIKSYDEVLKKIKEDVRTEISTNIGKINLKIQTICKRLNKLEGFLNIKDKK